MDGDSSTMLMLAVAPFALAMTISPGPNNMIIAAIAGQNGARGTMPYVLGTFVGVTALMLVLGLGAGEFLTRWPVLHSSLKVLGVVYLLWLAWRIAHGPSENRQEPIRSFGFGSGVVFQWVNPKAWMMTIGAFSTFTTVGGAVTAEILFITLTFVIAFIPAVALWTLVGLTARHVLRHHKAMKLFNICMAILIAASAVSVLL